MGPAEKTFSYSYSKTNRKRPHKGLETPQERIQSPNSDCCVTHRPRSATSAFKSFADEVQTMRPSSSIRPLIPTEKHTKTCRVSADPLKKTNSMIDAYGMEALRAIVQGLAPQSCARKDASNR